MAREIVAVPQLLEIMATLENHYRDLCDIEFTVERGKLWMLQTRSAKRTAQAAIRIAVELANEKLSFAIPSLSRSRTVASSPHFTGEGMSGGVGKCAPRILNICPT